MAVRLGCLHCFCQSLQSLLQFFPFLSLPWIFHQLYFLLVNLLSNHSDSASFADWKQLIISGCGLFVQISHGVSQVLGHPVKQSLLQHFFSIPSRIEFHQFLVLQFNPTHKLLNGLTSLMRQLIEFLLDSICCLTFTISSFEML